MTTMQAVVDLARVPLNDAKKVRYSDSVLLGYANSAIRRAYELRPDLAFDSYGTEYADLALDGTFPLSDKYKQTVADYISGRAEMKDDEAANSGRAQIHMQMFAAELLA